MGAALEAYKVQLGEKSNFAKFDGLLDTLQASLGAVGNPALNGFGTGLILDPNQLKQDGASVGQALVWNGVEWAPTTVPLRTVIPVTSTVTVTNTAAEKDLFTGNSPGATGGLLIPSAIFTNLASFRLIAGGTFLNNSGANHSITLRLTVRDSVGTFHDLWSDTTTNMTPGATPRAWRFKISGLFSLNVFGNRMFWSGKYFMADKTAVTAGAGPLLNLSSQQWFAPLSQFHDADITWPTGDIRLHFTVTHEVADVNLTTTTTCARLEVTA